MAIDIRATVTCSLGTLISASLSDDYLQGTGLVKCKGTVEISGTITPAIGTAVTFSYTKGGVTQSIPRKLRVLSSFADPFRRTTKVELGCKLTYLSDLKEPVNWSAFDDPENASYTEADAEIITIPINASSVMDECLSQLGLSASSNPLTNKFSIAKFDFGPGYVQVLSDLLVSESYCGYLDANEVLQVFTLSAKGGTGPVIDSTNIIDLGPIGVGQLPGEAVTVSYSSLRLKQGDVTNGAETGGWDSSTTSSLSYVVIPYTSPEGVDDTIAFNTYQTVTTETSYQTIEDEDGNAINVVASRTTNAIGSGAASCGSLLAAYYSNGISAGDFDVTETTIEFYTYANGKVSERVLVRYESNAKGFGAVGVPLVFSSTDYVTPGGGTYLAEKTIQSYSYFDDATQVVTATYGPWFQSLNGQQALAEGAKNYSSASSVSALLSNALSGEYLINYEVSIDRGSATQKAPTTAERINQNRAKGTGNPDNGYRTDSKAQLALALGSATAQRRIEFSLPYAPDDTFYKNESGAYTTTSSDAEAKATLYGRVQNMLLMGNRSGANFQLAPESLPTAPFAPFIVQANGLSALYRNNGTSWTMDASGVVVSTDALFWGAVGGTGSFWFPVAPGITTLPAAPAVVNGQMTVSNTVPVWNETVVASGTVRIGLSAQSLAYALSALTTVPAQSVKVTLQAARITKVAVPASSVAITALVPQISTEVLLAAPATNLLLAPLAPVVSVGTSVQVPLSNLTLQALTPESAGADATIVGIPATNLGVDALVPAVQTGVSVTLPAVAISVAASAPEVGGNLVEAFGLTALLADDLLDLDF